jgi:hypothetical protein
LNLRGGCRDWQSNFMKLLLEGIEQELFAMLNVEWTLRIGVTPFGRDSEVLEGTFAICARNQPMTQV